jgi:hypothetical protein
MDTSTIVCLGIAATSIAVSIFCTLRVLSQVSEDDDAHLKQLMQKRNKKDE